MNRALLMVIATAVVGGGLAFLALQDPGQGTAEDPNDEPIQMSAQTHVHVPVDPASKKSDEAALTDLGDAPRATMAATGGMATAWEINPMNGVGQALATATVRAVPAPEVGRGVAPLEGVGRITFDNVPSGTWTLTVTTDDAPTWTRDIEVAANKKLRTPVKMGPEIQVTGMIRDSNGAPLSRNTPVFLLPKNAPHPTGRGKRPSGKQGNVAKGLPGGVIAVQTNSKGVFSATLPEAGEYRVSVGDIRNRDAARWTQKEAFTATNGGPDYIVTTIPARPELTLRFEGSTDERPSAAATYVYNSQLAADLAREAQQEVERERSAMTREEIQKQAKLEALGYAEDGQAKGEKGGGKKGAGGRGAGKRGARDGRRSGTGTARSAREENRRMQEQDFDEQEEMDQLERAVDREPLFEPGWRSIGSRPLGADGEAVFVDLPENQDIRFLFIRDQERITTAAPIRMRPEQRGIGVISLPAPVTGTSRSTSNLASVLVKDRPADDASPTFPVGVVWSVKER